MSDTRNVLVTGASTGIGRTTAEHLKARGFHVIAGVRKEADGKALADQGIEIALIDVTDSATIEATAKQVGDRPLAGLVNNAGIPSGGPLEYLPLDKLRQVLEVNVIGLVATTQAMLPALRRGTGRVVNISSISGRVSSPFVGPYSASKFAVEALSDAWRQELAPWGLKVISVEPGSVATPIWTKAAGEVAEAQETYSPEALERYASAMTAMDGILARLDKMGIAPVRVAKVIEKALTVRNPRPRYLVGPDAHAQVGVKTLLPTRVLDRATAKLMRL